MAKKDMVPDMTQESMEPSSTITYASEVVATIASLAASEVEGIASMGNAAGSIMSKTRNTAKGIKVEVGTEEASIDLYVNVEYGTPIQKAAQTAQENVRRTIESMTGLHVVRVDVHVQGVSFDKENKSLTAGTQTDMLESGSTAAEAEVKAAPEAEEPVKAEETETVTAEETEA